MDRFRGYWWSPDGQRAAGRAGRRVAGAALAHRRPGPPRPAGRRGRATRPPGTPNADVTLAHRRPRRRRASTSRGTPTHLPYLAARRLAARARRRTSSCRAATSGAAGARGRRRRPARRRSCTRRPTPPGSTSTPACPAWLADGRLVWLADRDDAPPAARRRRAGDAAGAAGLARCSASGDDWVLLEAVRRARPSGHVYRWSAPPGSSALTSEPGLHGAARRRRRPRRRVGRASVTPAPRGRSSATAPSVGRARPRTPRRPTPGPARRAAPDRRARRCGRPSSCPATSVRTGPLPVLMDPYGGPHARVRRRRPRRLPDVAVVRRPGLRGRRRRRPGHAGPRAAPGTRASTSTWPTPALEDQVDALHGVAEQFPGELDLDRVAIRGWSFGGYLAALAVLRRPDVFHAAVAGAPVTDWRLYDTHYTERYLGDPADAPGGVRRATSLLDDAAKLDAPAAADPRPGRRQRGRRPHPAAVVGAARRRAGRTPCCRCAGSPT